MKMTKYDVIAQKAKTGEERILATIEAEDQVDAKKKAVREYFGQVNMIQEHLMVVRHTNKGRR